jgi:hypothetical protein
LERYTGGIDVQAVLKGVKVFGNGEETAPNLNDEGAFCVVSSVLVVAHCEVALTEYPKARNKPPFSGL